MFFTFSYFSAFYSEDKQDRMLKIILYVQTDILSVQNYVNSKINMVGPTKWTFRFFFSQSNLLGFK